MCTVRSCKKDLLKKQKGKPHTKSLCGRGEELNMSFLQKSGLAKEPVMGSTKGPWMEQFHSSSQEGALERGSTCVLRKAKRGYAWTHTL